MRTLASLAIAVVLVLAGCGDDDGGGGNPAVTPKVEKAVDQCLDQAKSIQDKDARKTAEEACKAAESGDTGEVKSAVKKQCLEAVKQIPDSAKDQKEAARNRCEAIK
jgi:entry exclusion lipoprotein TrbK